MTEILKNMNMQKINKYLFFFFVGLVILFSGCRTAKAPVAQKDSAIRPVWASEADKLRSTVLLIEATRQKNLGNWQQATILYHDAVTADPGNDAAHFELARIHAMQGEFNDALTYAKTAAGLSPQNPYYQVTLADIYILSNRLGDAINIYEGLVKDHPGNTEYAYSLATAYLYSKQPDKALEIFSHIESMVGFSEEISIEKQKIWVEQKQYGKAIEEAKKLIGVFPDELIYYELLADLYREAGLLHEAGKTYEEMLNADPGNPVAQVMMADYYLETGNKEEGFAYLKKAFSNPRIDFEGQFRIIYRLYLLSEKHPDYLEQGLALCRMMMEQHPDNPESYLFGGDFLIRAGQSEEAREAYLKAVELDPSNLSVWQQILGLDGQLSDFEAMRKHSDKALEYFFEQPVLFLFNGLASLQLKDYESAASSLEFGLAMTESSPELKGDFLSLLGDTYHYLNQNEQSDRHYEMALEINPQNATVLNNYSYHLAVRKERLDEAEAMSRKANALEEDNAAFLDTYGWIMYQKGRYDEAREWIRRSLDHSETPSGAVLEHYGDVMYRLGKPDEALRFWEKALETGDGTELLERKIKDKTLYE